MTEVKPNCNGVYPDEASEAIVYEGKKASAKIRVLELPMGWIASRSYHHRTGSYQSSSGPLMTHETFPNKETAIRAQASSIAYSQQRILAEHSSVTSNTQREEAENILKWATDIITNGRGPATQANLF